ncbi:hypothetical protein ABZT02_16045 [Streptomyces sp. NPDC005402]|uniref:hypothetical protein n=1 Tax=Streptomyces sp. NPDC005402 TaxID=3155338 RepID=UPI0033A8DBEC
MLHTFGRRLLGALRNGKLWPDGSLRPALVDLLGAGAVIAALRELVGDTLSPEAAVAARAFRLVEDVSAGVAGCVSGREPIEAGFPEDVLIATEVDVSTAGAFTGVRTP